MFIENLKFFGPTTLKSKLLKFFEKIHENPNLIANISQLHEYQSFVLNKICNMGQILLSSC